jgi:prepilin-type N-terminal cleavage/methylation domain-containing protein
MTLIEVMIAVAILGFMMTIAWTTLKSASDARTIATPRSRSATTRSGWGMARLVADLESAYLSKNEDKSPRQQAHDLRRQGRRGAVLEPSVT